MPVRKFVSLYPRDSPHSPPSSRVPRILHPKNVLLSSCTPAGRSSGIFGLHKICAPSQMSTKSGHSGSTLCSLSRRPSNRLRLARETLHVFRLSCAPARMAECLLAILARPVLEACPRFPAASSAFHQLLASWLHLFFCREFVALPSQCQGYINVSVKETGFTLYS